MRHDDMSLGGWGASDSKIVQSGVKSVKSMEPSCCRMNLNGERNHSDPGMNEVVRPKGASLPLMGLWPVWRRQSAKYLCRLSQKVSIVEGRFEYAFILTNSHETTIKSI